MAKELKGKVFTMAVTASALDRWKSEAAGMGVSLAALVTDRMERSETCVPLGPPASEIANDLASALTDLGEANEIIERQETEIAAKEARIGELERKVGDLSEKLKAARAGRVESVRRGENGSGAQPDGFSGVDRS